MFFKKKENETLNDDTNVFIESSICTGEKIIGFRDDRTGTLKQAVVVREQADIDDFYRIHKLKNTKNFKIWNLDKKFLNFLLNFPYLRGTIQLPHYLSYIL